MPSTADAVTFLERQREVQRAAFTASEGNLVLGFLGTTSARGTCAALSLHPLLGLEPSGGSFRLRLRGPLARAPHAGESVAVSLTDWERFRGYQLKTSSAHGPAERAGDAPPPGETALQATQVFTVHHTPNTVHMFETIPADDVMETGRVARWAVAGVGPMVNLSPRFLTAFEVVDGALWLFHGEGHTNKTWINLQQNSATSTLVFDRADGTGLVFEGRAEVISAPQAPRSWAETQTRYARLGYGPPASVYRQLVRRIERA